MYSGFVIVFFPSTEQGNAGNYNLKVLERHHILERLMGVQYYVHPFVNFCVQKLCTIWV
jgi:hypothetical protein